VGCGTIFRVSKAGDFKLLAVFDGHNGSGPNGVILGSDGDFYGTTFGGGENEDGTVFRMKPDGKIRRLASFSAANQVGVHPRAGLVEGSNGLFYGTAAGGGENGCGVVFSVSKAGDLAVVAPLPCVAGTNAQQPYAPLTVGADGTLYGTVTGPGDGYCDQGCGYVFSVDPNTGAFQMLATFNGTNGANPWYATVLEGQDGNLYGVTNGTMTGNNVGTLFRVGTDGSNFTTLVTFDGTNGTGPSSTLIQAADGTIYGTASGGGAYANGTIFSLDSAGNLTTLDSFNPNNYASVGPTGAIVREGSHGAIYGTTLYGGPDDYGTVYKYTP
jgi:uncharacterized repeat protein (TIGR03803 family)